MSNDRKLRGYEHIPIAEIIRRREREKRKKDKSKLEG